MTRKRFKKLLMAKYIQRNEANYYLDTTSSEERQEVLDGIYILSKDHFFVLDENWFDNVSQKSIFDTLADFILDKESKNEND